MLEDTRRLFTINEELDQPSVTEKHPKLKRALFKTAQAVGLAGAITSSILIGLHVAPLVAVAAPIGGVAMSVGSLITEYKYKKARLAKYDHRAQAAAKLLLTATHDLSTDDSEIEDCIEEIVVNSPDSAVGSGISGETTPDMSTKPRGRKVSPQKQTSFVKCMVLELIGTVGHLPHTEANRIVISDHAKQLMERHGLRLSHIGRNLRPVVEAYFFPSVDEICYRQAAIFQDYQERLEDHRRKPIGGFWSWALRRSVLENTPKRD